MLALVRPKFMHIQAVTLRMLVVSMSRVRAQVLEMHIPEDGPMSPDAVAAGMREAAANWEDWSAKPALSGQPRPLFKVFTVSVPEWCHTCSCTVNIRMAV